MPIGVASLVCKKSVIPSVTTLALLLNPWKPMLKTIMKTMKKMDKKAAADIIQNVENFLFDCDGVLWHASTPLPGCSETVHKLKKMGKRILYITNNSSKTRAELVEKCNKLGFPAEEDDIVCTAHITAEYLKKINFKGKLYMVGNPAMGYELDKAGIKHTGLGPDGFEAASFDDAVKYSHTWQPDPEVTGVLVGFDAYHSYMKMMKAASYAKNKKILFLATNEDPFLPVAGDVCIPGTGSIVLSVKYPARREPLIIGKPSTTMFDVLHETHGLEADKSMIVGDSLKTDIAMGGHCKLRTLLVLTGVNDVACVEECYKSSDPDAVNQIPDLYTQTFADLGDFIDTL